MDGALSHIKETYFKQFIKPFLRHETDKGNYTYFREQAWRLWILGFKREDVEKINILQDGYNKLYIQNEKLFIIIVNQIYSKLHDTRIIVESSSWEYNSVSNNEIEKVFKRGFEYYKSLFESEFSLWITLFYTYVIECHNPKLKTSDSNYLNVGASQKRKTLEDQKFSVLIDGIDHKIRNAGSGHESWEITDDGECLYKDIDPKTGIVKDTFQISISDLSSKIKEIEKAALIIDLSLHIFLANNPDIQNKVGYSVLGIKPKISEISRMASNFASEFQLKINKFDFSKDRSKLDLEIFHPHQPKTIGASQIYTNLGGHDVIKKRWSVLFIDQALGIIWDILHLNESKACDLHLKIIDEDKGDIYEGDFSKDVLQKWLENKTKKKIYPLPNEGVLPEETYSLVASIRVIYGYGDHIQNILDNPLFTEEFKDMTVTLYNLD